MSKELVALKFVTEDKKTVVHISVIYTVFDSRVAIQHMKDENSSLYRHSFLTDHVIDYCKPEILAKDSIVFRLCVKETLKIQDYYAHKSLNENTGSFKLALW